MRLKHLLLISTVAVLATACGGADGDFTDSGGSSGSTPTVPLKVRKVYLTGPVLAGAEVLQEGSGVPARYQRQITDSAGGYLLHPSTTSQTVWVGGIRIAGNDTDAAALPNLSALTPLQTAVLTRASIAEDTESAYAANKLFVLHYLDADANPENGYQFTEAERTRAAKVSFDFRVESVDFQTDPQVFGPLQEMAALSGNGARGAFYASDAVVALENNYLNALVPGVYDVQFANSFAASPGLLTETLTLGESGRVNWGSLDCPDANWTLSRKYDAKQSSWMLSAGQISPAGKAVCDAKGKPYIETFGMEVNGLGDVHPAGASATSGAPAGPASTSVARATVVVFNPSTGHRSTPSFLMVRRHG